MQPDGTLGIIGYSGTVHICVLFDIIGKGEVRIWTLKLNAKEVVGNTGNAMTGATAAPSQLSPELH